MRNLIHRIIRNLTRLHTLDYIIIGALVLSAGAFLFLKLTQKTKWIPVSVLIEWQKPWYTLSLSRGATAFDSFGRKTAEVTDIQTFDVGGGGRETYVSLNLKATLNSKTKTYTYNFQPLTVGTGFKTSFGTQDMQGIVTFVGDDKPFVDKIIEAKLLYVYPWVAESFSKGLRLQDSTGRVIAEIEDMSVQDAQRYEFKDMQNRIMVVSGEDQMRKDVTFRIKLKAKEYNGTYYFTWGVLKVGNGIHLEFPNVTAQNMEISAIIK